MNVVGLSGVAEVGKDVGAQGLVRELGFTRIAFADTLREAIYRLNPILAVYRSTVPDNPGAVRPHTIRVQDVVDELGWDRAKREWSEVRELLQRMGTEVGRQLIDDNVWINVVFDRAKREGVKNLVIPDVRFPNELFAVNDYGGYTFRIIRPGYGPVNAHASDNALNDEDFAPMFRIHNDCSELEYQQRVCDVVEQWVIL